MASYLTPDQELALDQAFTNALQLGGFRFFDMPTGFSIGKLINDVAKDEAGIGTLSVAEYNGGPGNSVLLKSYMVDGASALGVVIDTNVLWANSGAKLLSLRNHGSEQASFDLNGKLRTNNIGSATASGISVFGAPTDASNAVGIAIGSSTSLANASAKLVTIKNSGTEKAFFDKNGALANSTTVNFKSYEADGATALAAVLDTSTAWVNASSALFKIKNNSITKVTFDFDGNLTAGAATFTGGVSSASLATPVAGAFTTDTTGGTLTPGTYYYRISATNAIGETLASTEASKVVPAGTNTNTVTVIWGVVPGATGYKIYGRATGAELFLAAVSGGTTLSYLDDGSATPSGALPTRNTTGVISAPEYNAGSGATLLGVGYMADGASAVGTALDTNVAYANAGAKLLSIRNAGTEKAFFDKNGSPTVPTLTATTGVTTPLVTASAAGQAVLVSNAAGYIESAGPSTLLSGVADGASAVSAIANTSTAWVNAGAKLFSFRNNGSEKLFVDVAGAVASGTIPLLKSYAADGASAVAGASDTSTAWSNASAKLHSFRNNNVEKAYIDVNGALANGTTVALKSYAADGGSALAGSVDTSTAWSTAGAKLFSFKTNNVEKSYISKTGEYAGPLLVSGQATGTITHNGTQFALGSRVSQASYYESTASGGNTGFLNSNGGAFYSTVGALYASGLSDGASAIAHTFNNNIATLSNATAKLMSIQNHQVEKTIVYANGEIEETVSGAGILLHSPDGTRYRITVANGGTLSIVAAP